MVDASVEPCPMAAPAADSAQRSRQRWSASDLTYLDFWAAVKPVQALCHHLQRTERAVRCQMHRRGLSARVREGWGLPQLREDLHLSAKTVLRYAAQGVLRVHCAKVRLDCWPVVPGAAATFELDEVAHALRWLRKRVLSAALAHRCRLMQVRITDASVMRLVASDAFSATRARLSPAMIQWLQESA